MKPGAKALGFIWLLQTNLSAVDLQQFLLELLLDPSELGLSFSPAGAAIFLNLDDFIEGGNQHFVGVAQGLNVDNTALGFPGGLNRCPFQRLSVFAQQFVGHL